MVQLYQLSKGHGPSNGWMVWPLVRNDDLRANDRCLFLASVRHFIIIAVYFPMTGEVSLFQD